VFQAVDHIVAQYRRFHVRVLSRTVMN